MKTTLPTITTPNPTGTEWQVPESRAEEVYAEDVQVGDRIRWVNFWLPVLAVEQGHPEHGKRQAVYITTDPGDGPRRNHYYADEIVRRATDA